MYAPLELVRWTMRVPPRAQADQEGGMMNTFFETTSEADPLQKQMCAFATARVFFSLESPPLLPPRPARGAGRGARGGRQ